MIQNIANNVDKCNELYHSIKDETRNVEPQTDRAAAMLKQRGMARLSEFIEEGITAATIARMKKSGLITQLGRGLYQLPDAPLDANHSLAEAAKLVPKGIVCLDSALAFHELTDVIPRRIWMAIGARQWAPRDHASADTNRQVRSEAAEAWGQDASH